MSEKKAKVVKPEVQAKFGPSLLVFLLVTAVILVGILVLGLDAHIPIVIAAMIVAVYGIILHVPFKDLEHAMIKTISESVPVLLLICIVGMLIGSWMSAGTVPVIIYVGLELLRPSIFLPFVAIMCAILSTMTGSSWTTCSTIGVAFMGISVGLGIPLPITAGAVACGAYFGDKQSPISDFCIYAAGVTKVDIYKHAKRMIWTTGPAFLISLVIFTIIGLKYSGGTLDASAIETIRGGRLQDGLAHHHSAGCPDHHDHPQAALHRLPDAGRRDRRHRRVAVSGHGYRCRARQHDEWLPHRFSRC